jgi:Leucine rich repeat variant
MEASIGTLVLIVLGIRVIIWIIKKSSENRDSGRSTTQRGVDTMPAYRLADTTVKSPFQADLDADLPAKLAAAADTSTLPEELGKLARNPRLAAIVAGNPSTPTPVLKKLGESWDPDVWRAVAGNPNADRDVLLRLAPTYPGEFFANPIVPLLLLEHPDVWLQYDRRVVTPLVQHPDALPGLLAILTHHYDSAVAADARLHVNLAGELSSDEWAGAAADELWQLQLGHSDDRLCLAIDDGAVAPWLIPPLILHGNEDVRLALGHRTDLPPEILALFRRAGAPRQLVGYASPRHGIAPGELERLMRGGAWARGLVARHPCAPPVLLSQLAADLDVNIRCTVARNNATPPTVLSGLAGDEAGAIRKEAAYNRSTPLPVLERLARDHGYHVRSRVARNPSTSSAVVSTLAGDECWQVRRLVALRPDASLETLSRLAEDVEPRVRFEVARHPAITPTMIERLSGDPDPVIGKILLRRADLSESLRARLASMPGIPRPARKESVAKNRAAEPETTPPGTIAVPRDRSDLLLEGLLALLDKPELDTVQRAIALAHPILPQSRLSASFKAVNWIERFAVARNPSTPREVLQLMVKDANRLVRAAARSMLTSAQE